jgi:hypothetical protein
MGLIQITSWRAQSGEGLQPGSRKASRFDTERTVSASEYSRAATALVPKEAGTMIRDHCYVSIHQSGTFHPPPNEPATLSRYLGDIYPATVRAYVDPLQSNLPYGPSIRRYFHQRQCPFLIDDLALLSLRPLLNGTRKLTYAPGRPS